MFVPRPETEALVGWALDTLRAGATRPLVVDLCSGSGAIALAVAQEYPAARVIAVELADRPGWRAAPNVAALGTPRSRYGPAT